MSTADKLNALVLTKADIKLALIDKGLNPSDVFSTYADDIRAIETGGGVFDFASLGYTGDEEPLKSGLAYAMECKNTERPNSFKYRDDLNLVILPMIDLSKELFLNEYFSGCKNLILIPKLNIQGSIAFMFKNCVSLQSIPLMDYSKCTDLSFTFLNCALLRDVGIIDCSQITDLSNTFDGCGMLTYNPIINTDLVTKMCNLFRYTSLKEFNGSDFNTSNVIDMNKMFNECRELETINVSNFNTAKVTDMGYMFAYSTKVKSLDLSNFDTNNVTTTQNMFSYMTGLENIILPENFGVNSTNMNQLFSGCSKLNYIGNIYSNKAAMDSIFSACDSLIKVESINFENLLAASLNYLVGYSRNNSIRYLVIKNIGNKSSSSYNFNFSYISNWGVEDESIPMSLGAKQSLIDSLITYSFDRATAGYTSDKITLSASTKALLTEEEIAQITAKGFTIV